MNVPLVQGLHDALDELAADRSARVVILTGEGRGFCAGLDLRGFGQLPGHEGRGRVQQGLAVQQQIASLIPHMRRLDKPIIAAVNGPAAGGGVALVLGSGIRIAAASAKFNAAFVRIGLSACDMGTSWLLPRLVGAGRAHELMLTGRRFDASEAERMGLLTAVVDPDRLRSAALAKAAEIQLNPPFSVQLTKQGMWLALEMPSFDAAVEFENRQQVITALTDDQKEATRAFLDKRNPDYRYR